MERCIYCHNLLDYSVTDPHLTVRTIPENSTVTENRKKGLDFWLLITKTCLDYAAEIQKIVQNFVVNYVSLNE